MKQITTTLSLVIAAALLLSFALPALLPSAVAQHGQGHGHMHEHAALHLPPFAGVNEGVAVIHPTEGNDTRGQVRFHQHEDGRVTITARVEGLNPNQNHGFHVHEFGDCSAPDATSAGGHYNPAEHPHGLPNGEDHLHAGDLGNLEANEDGIAEFELTVDNISVAGANNPVIGRAVIVHRDEDDGSQPLGDAGPRIGCGVIGVAQMNDE